MTDLASADYFSDGELAQNPFEYFDDLRSRNPVFREPNYGVVVVTGYQEVVEGFKNSDALSAVNAIGGPFPPLPFEPEGDDITEQIEAHRHLFPISEHMVVMDPPSTHGHDPAGPTPHSEAAERERGVPVDSRRSATRRVHRQR